MPEIVIKVIKIIKIASLIYLFKFQLFHHPHHTHIMSKSERESQLTKRQCSVSVEEGDFVIK